MRILCAVVYTSMIYGRSPGEIARYLCWEMADRGTGPIRLPAVGDDGPDRFAMFLGERKPDERYIVRFPQNVDGDYEAYGHPVWMYGPYPVRGVYTQPMRAIPATEACYVIGNESEKLTEVRLRVDAGLDESVSIPAPPSLTIWRFAGKDMGWRLVDRYFDARGEERSWRLKTIM